MKSTLLIGMAVGLLAMTSCDEASRLAGKVEGTWKGEPTEILPAENEAAMTAMNAQLQCTPTITFTRAANTPGGNIALEGVFTLTHDITASSGLSATHATVSGTLKAYGSWNAKDDDEISVTFDRSKTQVEIIPSSLQVAYLGMATDSVAPSQDELKASIAPNIQATAQAIIATRLASVNEFDDVQLRDNILTFEVNDAHIRLAR